MLELREAARGELLKIAFAKKYFIGARTRIYEHVSAFHWNIISFLLEGPNEMY